MATKKKPKLPNKNIVKTMINPKEKEEIKPKKEKKEKVQRYVRIDKVKAMESKGWKVIEEKSEKKLGVRTNASDLILMEK